MSALCILRSWAIAFVIVLAAPAAVHSQQPSRASKASSGGTPNSPRVEDIREHAARLAKYRDLLNDKDPNVRQAAFLEMANSADPALQEIAYEAAFSSQELAMRSLALRTRLTHLSTFSFDLEGDNPQTITWRTVGSDVEHGVIWLQNTTNVGQNTVTATGLQVTVDTRYNLNPACSGILRLDEAGALSGVLACSWNRQGEARLKATSRLF
jgi:hypothetical protein